MKPLSLRTSRERRGTDTDMSVTCPLMLLETLALVVWDRGQARWNNPRPPLQHHDSSQILSLHVFVLACVNVFVCMSPASMHECLQTPVLRCSTTYWLNSGSFRLPTCSSLWLEEPKISTWRPVSRMSSTEDSSKWLRQQVTQTGTCLNMHNICKESL